MFGFEFRFGCILYQCSNYHLPPLLANCNLPNYVLSTEYVIIGFDYTMIQPK